MKLFHIFRTDDDGPLYNCAHGFVIRAYNQYEARAIAADSCGDEGKGLWQDPTQSECVHLTGCGNIGLVIRDFIHG